VSGGSPDDGAPEHMILYQSEIGRDGIDRDNGKIGGNEHKIGKVFL
jgi:hypothetical protein